MIKTILFSPAYLCLFLIINSCAVSQNKINNNTTNKNKPKIIGIIGTTEENEGAKLKEQITALPFYWIRQNYLNNIAKVCKKQNVSFVMLPLDTEQLDKIADSIDGLILTGGDESLYSSKRANFEQKLLKKITKQQKQILGICRGYQTINYVFSKDEIKDKEILKNENLLNIKRDISNKVKHNDSAVYLGKDLPKHKVQLNANSRLAKILGKTDIIVNSKHSFAINKIGKNVLLYGVSPEDGVPEMIEIKGYPKFLMGVQWHPEFLSTDDDIKLLQAFCKAVENNE